MRTRAEITPQDKEAVRVAISEVIERVSEGRAVCAEAVANEAFYWLQRHPQWGRNASLTDKRASHRHWGSRCHRCKQYVSFEEAKFHHLFRGIPEQHGPDNLVPEHLHCHDEEHGAIKGSLSKGSLTRKSRGAQQTAVRERVKKRAG